MTVSPSLTVEGRPKAERTSATCCHVSAIDRGQPQVISMVPVGISRTPTL